MRNDWISTVLLAVLLGALVYLSTKQVIILQKIQGTHMTDPGPLELKATWIHAYNGSTPIYHVVTVVRNAPSETITDWKRRFKEQVASDLENPDTKPYED